MFLDSMLPARPPKKLPLLEDATMGKLIVTLEPPSPYDCWKDSKSAQVSLGKLRRFLSVLNGLALTKHAAAAIPGVAAYVLTKTPPRAVVEKLKLNGWSGAPTADRNAYALQHKDYPGLRVLVEFASDLEADDIAEWGLSADSKVAMVSVTSV